MTESKKRGLGRGLGALIPTAPGSRTDTTALRQRVPGGHRRLTPSTPSTGVRGGRRRPVLGALRRDPGRSITPNPRQPRQVFDEEALAELVHSLREVGLLQPIVVRPLGGDRYELVAGERRWRAAQQAGFATIPADRPRHRRRRAAAGRPAGEPAPGPAQPAGGGRRLRPAAQRLRLHPGGAGDPDRPLAPPGVEHPSAAAPAVGGPAAGRRRRAVGRPRPGPAGARRPPRTRSGWPNRIVAEGLSVRTVEELVALGDVGADKPAQKRTKAPQNPALADLAAALSDDLETRVTVDLGRSQGQDHHHLRQRRRPGADRRRDRP